MRNTKRPYINCLAYSKFSINSTVWKGSSFNTHVPFLTCPFLAHYKNVDCAQLCSSSVLLASPFTPGAGVTAECPQVSTLRSASPTEMPLVLALFLEPVVQFSDQFCELPNIFSIIIFCDKVLRIHFCCL